MTATNQGMKPPGGVTAKNFFSLFSDTLSTVCEVQNFIKTSL